MGGATPALMKKHPRSSPFIAYLLTKLGRVSVLQLNKHPTQLFQKRNKK